jgi:predicted nucleic acid-binding protein
MLALVDTNVLLRTVDPAHLQHALAAAHLRACRLAAYELCVVPQVHYEFWVVATRAVAQNGLGMTTAEATAQLAKLGPPLFRLLRDERAIYDEGREVVARHQAQGKQAHDARLVAAMRRHGITYLVTFNTTDFQRYPGITLLDPMKNLPPP